MNAPDTRPCEGCENRGCSRIAVSKAREALDAARRDHLAAVRDAVVCGVPLAELAEDCEAAGRAMRDMLALAGEGEP